MPSVVTLQNPGLRVEIAELGSELVRLTDAVGRDYLWSGDPSFWKGRAPLLFPMVGRALGDHIVVKGQKYPLPQHGLARQSNFQTVEASAQRCMMRLESSEASLKAFPFAFRLDVVHELRDDTLLVTATVSNPGEELLPCSFGFHPAFRWPLPGGGGAAEILFEKADAAPIRRLDGDSLIAEETFANPLGGRRLSLDHALFEDGAVIFDQLDSRRATYGAPGGPEIEIAFPDLPHFALWTKPGAPFICLEPWQGFAAPVGYDGEFSERPGVVSIAPGETRRFGMEITVHPAA